MVYLLVFVSFSGISIVLDLTPNYKGDAAWFSNIPDASAVAKLNVSQKVRKTTYRVYKNERAIVLHAIFFFCSLKGGMCLLAPKRSGRLSLF